MWYAVDGVLASGKISTSEEESLKSGRGGTPAPHGLPVLCLPSADGGVGVLCWGFSLDFLAMVLGKEHKIYTHCAQNAGV